MKLVNGIWFPSDDTHFSKMMNDDGAYQRDIFSAAMECVKAPKIFFDIGAHVGLWSLMALKAGFIELHAFEPNVKTFECLKKNLECKKYSYKGYLYNYGVASIKNVCMRVVEEAQGNSGAVKLVNNEPDRDGFVSNAAVAPISDSFRLHEDIARLDIKAHECVVKIDTEGMEASCVLGMDKIIYALRPVVIVEQRTNMDALDILQKMGMQIVKQVRKDYILTWKNQ